jgi:hypothetical protein
MPSRGTVASVKTHIRGPVSRQLVMTTRLSFRLIQPRSWPFSEDRAPGLPRRLTAHEPR